MTTGTVSDREGNTSMTSPTKLTVDNLDHRNRIGTLLHHKDAWMAIAAIEPKGMWKMRKDHIRHGTHCRDFDI